MKSKTTVEGGLNEFNTIIMLFYSSKHYCNFDVFVSPILTIHR